MKKYLTMDAWMSEFLQFPQHVFLVGLRLWLAWIFFRSGLVKLQSWDVTLELFSFEYTVPWLSPVVAAWLATAAELCLPALLLFGVLTRPAVCALFVLNVVAMLSYPDISPAGEKDHQLWGLSMVCIFLLGAGRFSLDHLARRWADDGKRV